MSLSLRKCLHPYHPRIKYYAYLKSIPLIVCSQLIQPRRASKYSITNFVASLLLFLPRQIDQLASIIAVLLPWRNVKTQILMMTNTTLVQNDKGNQVELSRLCSDRILNLLMAKLTSRKLQGLTVMKFFAETVITRRGCVS